LRDWNIEIPDARYFERLIACREGCPVHTDARGYVQAVAHGDAQLGYRIARAPNPFASICGRVCGAPCEAACRRGNIDEPVSIRALKRYCTERHGVEVIDDLRETLRLSTAPGSIDPEPREERVAVVGGGVAGLTCAHDLARLGYRVTVFEASEAPGGMLRVGVPVFRLSNELVSQEIQAILGLGVELRCGVRIGSDLTLTELREQGFAAVFVGHGLQQSRMLDLPGHDLDGILPGLDLLERYNTGKAIPPLGRVVVIGGGDVAYDCARSSLRNPGTTSVTLACLEALEEMPASAQEILEGEEEKIDRRCRLGPARFVGEDGKITGLEVRQVSRVFDEQGRFAPEFVAGSETVIPADTVVMAIGQAGDTGFAFATPDLELGPGGTVVTDPDTGGTSLPWLFAGGDGANGPGLFIDAIAQAQTAARSIHTLLAGEEQAAADYAKAEERGFAMELQRENIREDYLHLDRRHPPCTDPAERVTQTDGAVELDFRDEEARRQGARCLRCEVETVFDGSKCILCGGCADVCPTYCLRLVSAEEIGQGDPSMPGAGAIIKDEERCIRCAMCAIRCPTDAITMERVCGYVPWQPVEGQTDPAACDPSEEAS